MFLNLDQFYNAQVGSNFILLFVIYLLINSDVMTERFFRGFDGAVTPHGVTTSYGTVLQGLALVFLYILVTATYSAVNSGVEQDSD